MAADLATPYALKKIQSTKDQEASFVPEAASREYTTLQTEGGFAVLGTGKKPELSPEDQAWATSIKKLFHDGDSNNDGFISEDELAGLFQTLAPEMSRTDLNKLFVNADKNSDGKIAYDEFVDWLMQPAADSLGRAIISYSQAFKPLFDAYDRDGTGVLSKANFEECHCLLQAALRMSGVEEDAAQAADPLKLEKDHQEAFAIVDTGGTGNITFVEFVDWMKAHIAASMGVGELKEYNVSLAKMLQNTFDHITMAEEGYIGEDSGILEGVIKKLAESTQALDAAVSVKAAALKSQWTRPPVGLSVDRLKATHMSLAAINMKRISNVTWCCFCLPMPGDYGDPEDRIWLAKVFRKVEWKSGNANIEEPAYYSYERKTFSWAPFSVKNHKDFCDVLSDLSPGIGLFCLLRTAANLGVAIDWSGIQSALQGGVHMRWMSEEQLSQYNTYMADLALQQIKDDGYIVDETERAEKWLVSSLSIRPRVVMATLSTLGVVDIDPAWEDCMDVRHSCC